ncbi:MAG: exosome complex protein Rrp42 [Halobacteriales archaeon]|nr:exosome complex protein Rrp42 [Halobacteriales archaeon]
MSDDIVSDIKRDYIVNLAKQGQRYDGRAFDEYRPISIETGLISRAEGSARVRIGDTEVVVGVKMAPGEPYPDTPASGVMTTSAELVPIASPDFETGPPRPASIELARVVDRGIRETDTIDLEKLCIKPGEKVWMSFIDIHVVDYDGNLFDAASLGAMAALLSAKVPYARFELGADQPMPINHYPVSTTAIKLGPALVFDPGLMEDKVGRPRLTVAHDEHNAIRAMQKGLIGGFTLEEVKEIIATSKVKAREMREQLVKVTGREADARNTKPGH